MDPLIQALDIATGPVDPSGLPHLKDHSIGSLRTKLVEFGLPSYRADQIAGWLYRRGVDDPEAMTDLPADLRVHLASEWQTRALEVASVLRSVDGTIKAAFRTWDGEHIESVLIPERARNTLCISTQVGCPLACSFCATGALGFTRNLRTSEIIDQVCRMAEILAADDSPESARGITNVVFMGMGEPLLNLDAVLETIRLLIHPKAFALAPRRVTVSTVGVLPRLEPLLAVAPVNLAVSLHATTDAVRDQLVPLNRRFPLAELLDTLRGLETVTQRRPVFFEYTLIEGVNDSPEDAKRLAPLLAGIPSKLNLIPMNGHADSPMHSPDDATIDRFLRIVAGSGLFVSLRRSRGLDIDAACGQLALRHVARAAASVSTGAPPRWAR
ncbi:MAG: 23S rRNA (adenine(2503)-C(2))-methyltransferase RlmN [Myxococcales bacterium]|nr:23S rRNA (adenine(2503)-C(2))-methyltransferase RlmN [Myxococcales bacterium]